MPSGALSSLMPGPPGMSMPPSSPSPCQSPSACHGWEQAECDLVARAGGGGWGVHAPSPNTAMQEGWSSVPDQPCSQANITSFCFLRSCK